MSFQNLDVYDYEDTTIKFDGDSVIKHHPSFFDGLREVIMYKCLNHPHIIKCKNVEIINFLPKLDYEVKYEPVDVMKMVKITFDKYQPSNIGKEMKMFIEIIDAMYYLEQSEILHSDIKPDNIYYNAREDKFLLADFDLITMGKENYHRRARSPITEPPERDVNDSRGDVFSLGITISIFLTGKKWYQRTESEEEYNDALSKITKKIIFPEKKLLLAMLRFNYLERPTTKEIYEYFFGRMKYPKIQLIKIDNSEMEQGIYDDYINHGDPENDLLYRKSAQIAVVMLEKLKWDVIANSEEKAFLFLLIELSAFILMRSLTFPRENYEYHKKLPKLLTFKNEYFISENSYVKRVLKVNEINQELLSELKDENPLSVHVKLISDFMEMIDFRIF